MKEKTKITILIAGICVGVTGLLVSSIPVAVIGIVASAGILGKEGWENTV